MVTCWPILLCYVSLAESREKEKTLGKARIETLSIQNLMDVDLVDDADEHVQLSHRLCARASHTHIYR